VDLRVQLWGAGGVARVAHDAERRARGDRLVQEERLQRRLVFEVAEEDEVAWAARVGAVEPEEVAVERQVDDLVDARL
jgi:hypothetical protein